MRKITIQTQAETEVTETETEIEIPISIGVLLEVLDHIKKGKRINAMKLIRGYSDYGLKEALDFTHKMDTRTIGLVIDQLKIENPEYFL